MSNAYLRFWGVRGSYSALFDTHLGAEGNISCVEICLDDHILLCDAGTGIITFSNEMLKQKDRKKLPNILTHYYWDHICDLSFLLQLSSRIGILVYLTLAKMKEVLRNIFHHKCEHNFFPVGTETWLAKINYLKPSEDRQLNHGSITFSYQNVHHPDTTYNYRIGVNDKIVHYISGNECLYLESSIKQKHEELNDKGKELYDNMKKEENTTEIKMIKGADILIHDAQYTPEDYKKKRGWWHSCYIDAVINIAIGAKVKELYLIIMIPIMTGNYTPALPEHHQGKKLQFDLPPDERRNDCRVGLSRFLL